MQQNIGFVSVCSGIEAASVAWNQLGWRAIALSEIDKFPSAVLRHHHPDIPNLGDFTKIDVQSLPRVDVLAGGTPCQAFSVAGLRQSLDDVRGNLTLEFVRLVHELAANNGLRNVVWENVVGVLSTKDNAFGCFLAGLVGADFAIDPPRRGKWPSAGMASGPKGRAAWRVLDAQYFGVAQRRRRVLVVADFGNGADPAAVLFEQEGVRRHSPPSRETRQSIAAPTVRSVALRGRDGGGTAELGGEIGGTLRASNGGGDKPHVLCFAPEIARCVATREGSSQDYESTTIVAVAATLTATYGEQSGQDMLGDGMQHAVGVHGDIVRTLKAEGADASEDGTGRGTPVIAFSAKDYGGDAQYELSPTLRAGGHSDSHANAGVMPAIACRMAVRRLTPVECERLQGFPDNHTNIPWRGKPTSPDGPRYKAIGNSWAVPKFTWLGRRLAAALAAIPANDNQQQQQVAHAA